MSGNQLPANTGLQKLAANYERDSLVGTALGKETLRAARKSARDCNISALRRECRVSCGAYGAKRHKGNLLYWATVHSRIALWREIQNDFYAGRKDDSRTTRTVR
jgi:hypothetical protein